MNDSLYKGSSDGFYGFASPTSNTTYTPNQFFDVCLPHRSRGCVRIVAYLLRKTLGWSDEHGNPIHDQFAISYNDLIHKAGVSRDMIKTSIDEAIRYGFIVCLRSPSANQSGKYAASGLYELRWDDRVEYIKDPDAFQGFFAGEGNRTYIPNQFFDVVVRQETLSVIKVVGSITRFSIGFTTKWGHRKQHAAISLTDIQRYAKLRNRNKLVEAIKLSIEKHYINQVEYGYFDKTGRSLSRSSVYSLRWLNDNVVSSGGRKKIPEKIAPADRSENDTGNGQKKLPAKQSEKDTGIQITDINKTFKQQSRDVKLDSESLVACCLALKGEGFDESTAVYLASTYPINCVLNQIEWLPMRGPVKNRLGLLRRAIEQDYQKPDRQGKMQSGRPDSRETQLHRDLVNQLTIKHT